MRSIRRSMTAYLLVLFAVALGVVGVIIDQLTARAIDARERATAELIESRCEDRCRDERERIDQTLLQEAQELARIMQTEYWPRFQVELLRHRVALTVAPVGPAGNPMAASATAAAFPPYFGVVTPWSRESVRLYFAHLPLDPEYLKQSDEEQQKTDYFQINTLSGRVWRSRNLETNTLPFDYKLVDTGKLVEWRYDDPTVTPSGVPVRRITYKSPLLSAFGGLARPPGERDRPTGGGGRLRPPERSGWPPMNPPQPLPLPPPPPPPPPTPAQVVEAVPKIYVQCARPTAMLTKTLDGIRARRDEELDKLRNELMAERLMLRTRIATVGVFAFLAVAIGGPLLIGRGLRPVGKLSDAVSRVSEKDFSLPHDGAELPAELVPIHARLTQTLEMLRRAFEREKQSVADISHELRTPIASLLATLDVTLRKPRTPEQYRSTLEDCRAIARQLSHLVERIMLLASIDSGNARTAFSQIDLSELAAGCAAVIRPLAQAHGLNLDVHVPPLELNTDPDKLREVLMNLLHNAVEYNRPGGRVQLSAVRQNSQIVLEVSDTGIGMPPEIQERVFERFFRADPSRHATGVHAGLGLAIVKEYVDCLRGQIGVQSEVDQGSRFRVQLPIGIDDPGKSDSQCQDGHSDYSGSSEPLVSSNEPGGLGPGRREQIVPSRS